MTDDRRQRTAAFAPSRASGLRRAKEVSKNQMTDDSISQRSDDR